MYNPNLERCTTGALYVIFKSRATKGGHMKKIRMRERYGNG